MLVYLLSAAHCGIAAMAVTSGGLLRREGTGPVSEEATTANSDGSVSRRPVVLPASLAEGAYRDALDDAPLNKLEGILADMDNMKMDEDDDGEEHKEKRHGEAHEDRDDSDDDALLDDAEEHTEKHVDGDNSDEKELENEVEEENAKEDAEEGEEEKTTDDDYGGELVKQLKVLVGDDGEDKVEEKPEAIIEEGDSNHDEQNEKHDDAKDHEQDEKHNDATDNKVKGSDGGNANATAVSVSSNATRPVSNASAESLAEENTKDTGNVPPAEDRLDKERKQADAVDQGETTGEDSEANNNEDEATEEDAKDDDKEDAVEKAAKEADKVDDKEDAEDEAEDNDKDDKED